MTTKQKAEDLAYRYFRMARRHVLCGFSGTLVDLSDNRWSPDTEYSITPQVRKLAKQNGAYASALKVLGK
jgi:hypothetical protein